MQELKNVGVSILILLALLIPLDFVVGLFLDRGAAPNIERDVSLREWGPNSDTIKIPLARNLSNYPHLNPDGYRVRTDENGFILGPETYPDEAEVIFIGASTTECLYVDEDKRFPYLVGTKLVHAADGSPVGTVNAGFTGSHTLHMLVSLIAKIVPLQPKLVVLMLNGNDLTLLTRTGSYWESPESRTIIETR